jgi:hypothetical protein
LRLLQPSHRFYLAYLLVHFYEIPSNKSAFQKLNLLHTQRIDMLQQALLKKKAKGILCKLLRYKQTGPLNGKFLTDVYVVLPVLVACILVRNITCRYAGKFTHRFCLYPCCVASIFGGWLLCGL